MAEKLSAMPLWVDDFQRDTSHLSMQEVGAYVTLLMEMWRAGGALADDDEELAARCRMAPEQWHHIAPRLRKFFHSYGPAGAKRLGQKRLGQEINRVRDFRARMSEKGQRGAQKRWSTRNGLEQALNSLGAAAVKRETLPQLRNSPGIGTGNGAGIDRQRDQHDEHPGGFAEKLSTGLETTLPKSAGDRTAVTPSDNSGSIAGAMAGTMAGNIATLRKVDNNLCTSEGQSDQPAAAAVTTLHPPGESADGRGPSALPAGAPTPAGSDGPRRVEAHRLLETGYLRSGKLPPMPRRGK